MGKSQEIGARPLSIERGRERERGGGRDKERERQIKEKEKRKRERERGRGRKRERQTDRQTETVADNQTPIQQRIINPLTSSEEIDRQTDRQKVR